MIFLSVIEFAVSFVNYLTMPYELTEWLRGQPSLISEVFRDHFSGDKAAGG
jgi:hypothetical protein